MKNIFLSCVSVVLFPVCALTATTPDAIHTDLIKRHLNQWSLDFNAKKTSQVCELFAQDLVASYPGTEDRNYDQMCKSLEKAINDPSKNYQYDQPQIEQIIISDDVAVVRLIWTLTVTSPIAPEKVVWNVDDDLIDGQKQFVKGLTTVVKIEKAVLKEKGIDVFKRQADGHWKIAISYAYPLQTPSLDPSAP